MFPEKKKKKIDDEGDLVSLLNASLITNKLKDAVYKGSPSALESLA